MILLHVPVVNILFMHKFFYGHLASTVLVFLIPIYVYCNGTQTGLQSNGNQEN